MRYELAEADQADKKDQIVITVHETEENELYVRSVDLFSNPMKLRVSARKQTNLDSIFHNEIAEMIRRICAGATLAKQIINVPDFALRVHGLVIKGYTLLVHTLENGMRQFIVRLRRSVGNAMALFREWKAPGKGLTFMPAGEESASSRPIGSQRLFDEMLSHLYLPLVNLNSFLQQALESRHDGGAPEFSSSVVQLKTKAEVLQFAFDRVISEMMLEKYTGEEAAMDHAPKQIEFPKPGLAVSQT